MDVAHTASVSLLSDKITEDPISMSFRLPETLMSITQCRLVPEVKARRHILRNTTKALLIVSSMPNLSWRNTDLILI